MIPEVNNPRIHTSPQLDLEVAKHHYRHALADAKYWRRRVSELKKQIKQQETLQNG